MDWLWFLVFLSGNRQASGDEQSTSKTLFTATRFVTA